ncbi:MAG: cytochrome C oxidase subunit IV family protein [Acidobacteriota bacterium]
MSEHIVARKTYLSIFGALMVLTALTVCIAFINLGRLNTFVALTIAACKALLVILYFMHVRYSSKLTRVIALSGFFWLAIMITFVLSDYFTRNW